MKALRNGGDAAVSEPDVRVKSHLSLVLFEPLTPAAKKWIDENVEFVSSWQWLCGKLAVQPRHALQLEAGLIAAGFTVKG